jgi:hypothetical protein
MGDAALQHHHAGLVAALLWRVCDDASLPLLLFKKMSRTGIDDSELMAPFAGFRAILPPAVGILMSCVPRNMRSFSSGASNLFYNWLGMAGGDGDMTAGDGNGDEGLLFLFLEPE